MNFKNIAINNKKDKKYDIIENIRFLSLKLQINVRTGRLQGQPQNASKSLFWTIAYLLNATNALAFSTDSFFCNCSQAGNDHRNRPNLSIFPDCCRTSQTQATCSWVKPNEGNIAGDWGLGHEDERPELVTGPNCPLRDTAALVIPGIWMAAETSVICPTIITNDKQLNQFIKCLFAEN